MKKSILFCCLLIFLTLNLTNVNAYYLLSYTVSQTESIQFTNNNGSVNYCRNATINYNLPTDYNISSQENLVGSVQFEDITDFDNTTNTEKTIQALRCNVDESKNFALSRTSPILNCSITNNTFAYQMIYKLYHIEVSPTNNISWTFYENSKIMCRFSISSLDSIRIDTWGYNTTLYSTTYTTDSACVDIVNPLLFNCWINYGNPNYLLNVEITILAESPITFFFSQPFQWRNDNYTNFKMEFNAHTTTKLWICAENSNRPFRTIQYQPNNYYSNALFDGWNNTQIFSFVNKHQFYYSLGYDIEYNNPIYNQYSNIVYLHPDILYNSSRFYISAFDTPNAYVNDITISNTYGLGFTQFENNLITEYTQCMNISTLNFTFNEANKNMSLIPKSKMLAEQENQWQYYAMFRFPSNYAINISVNNKMYQAQYQQNATDIRLSILNEFGILIDNIINPNMFNDNYSICWLGFEKISDSNINLFYSLGKTFKNYTISLTNGLIETAYMMILNYANLYSSHTPITAFQLMNFGCLKSNYLSILEQNLQRNQTFMQLRFEQNVIDDCGHEITTFSTSIYNSSGFNGYAIQISGYTQRERYDMDWTNLIMESGQISMWFMPFLFNATSYNYLFTSVPRNDAYTPLLIRIAPSTRVITFREYKNQTGLYNTLTGSINLDLFKWYNITVRWSSKGRDLLINNTIDVSNNTDTSSMIFGQFIQINSQGTSFYSQQFGLYDDFKIESFNQPDNRIGTNKTVLIQNVNQNITLIKPQPNLLNYSISNYSIYRILYTPIVNCNSKVSALSINANSTQLMNDSQSRYDPNSITFVDINSFDEWIMLSGNISSMSTNQILNNGTISILTYYYLKVETKPINLFDLALNSLSPLILLVIFPLVAFFTFGKKAVPIGFIVGIAILGFIGIIPVYGVILLEIFAIGLQIFIIKHSRSETDV